VVGEVGTVDELKCSNYSIYEVYCPRSLSGLVLVRCRSASAARRCSVARFRCWSTSPWPALVSRSCSVAARSWARADDWRADAARAAAIAA
jgi:hypothetical protein